MKIVLYSLNFAPELTGIGKYSGEMADWLALQGHDVTVVCAAPYYPEWRVHAGFGGWRYAAESRRTGVGSLDVMRCPLWVPKQPSGRKRLLHLMSFVLTSLPVLLRMLTGRPDVLFVVAPALLVAPQALVLARLLAVPTWLHVQDFEVDAALGLGIVNKGWMSFVARQFEGFLLKRFDQVSTLSAAMRERLLRKGVASERASLLPNWVDMKAIRPAGAVSNGVRAELGIAAETTLLLYAGNMGEKQGLDVVVVAAERLQTTPGLLFLMVGTGAAHARLQARAVGLSNMVWWPLQPSERLNELLNAADIHLLPQRGDAADLVMPSKLGGMLASGRMVLGTAKADTELGRLLELTGVRVEPEQPELLADAIVRYACNRPARDERGAAGRRYAEDKLDIDPIMRRFVGAVAGMRPQRTQASPR